MSSRIILFCVSLLTVITIGCANKPIITVIEAPSGNGELESISGDVSIKSGQTGETGPATVKQKINPSDTIITTKNSRAKVVMSDQNELHVSPNSKVEIKNYGVEHDGKVNVLINLLNGKVRANVRQKYDGKDKTFHIQTPTAVAGVRGTEFAANFDEAEKRSQIVAFEGAVEFGLPGPDGTIKNAVSVAAGETSSSVAGQAPSSPEKVPKEKLAEMDLESKVSPPTPVAPPPIDSPPKASEVLPKLNSVDPQIALGWLMHGNQRFVKHSLRADGESKKDILRVSSKETPHAIILTCSDSRMAPEIIFDQKLGEIIVVRTLDAKTDQSVVASVELALLKSPARLLLILGGASCPPAQDMVDKLKVESKIIREAVEKAELILKTATYDLATRIVLFE